MTKRLITKDYQKFVFDAFTMPERDHYSHYLNIVEENHKYNHDIIDRLKEILNNWIDWYKSKVYGKPAIVKMPDGTYKKAYRNQENELDENGNYTISRHIDETLYPLLSEYKIDIHVNKAFFDNQIHILNEIHEKLNFEEIIKGSGVLSKRNIVNRTINEGFQNPSYAEYHFQIFVILISKLSDAITIKLRNFNNTEHLKEAKDVILKIKHIAENTTNDFIKATYRNHKADILERLEIIEKQLNKPLEPQPIKSEPKAIKNLSDLITHKESSKIVEDIKVNYRNIKGKRLKLLLLAFQKLELIPKERSAKRFHQLCEIEFDWNINTYNAMNGYSYNEKTDHEDLTGIIEHIKALIKTD